MKVMSAQKQNNYRLGKAESKKRQRLSELGIEYDFPGYAALLPNKEKDTAASNLKSKAEPNLEPDLGSTEASSQKKLKVLKTSELPERGQKEPTAPKLKKQTPKK